VKQPLNALIVHEGEGKQDAIDLGNGIYQSKGISNSYLITTSDGDILVNAGMYSEAAEIERRFSQVSSNRLRVIIFTQAHADHVGGWSHFGGTGVETIAQANHADVREYWLRLAPYYGQRTAKLWGRDLPGVDRAFQPPEPVITTTFEDHHSFTLGGRRVELYSTPGGETTCSLVVWLPQDRTAFTGNLTGPLFGHVPNLYTVRGDKIRSARGYIKAVDRVIALEPETLITGHGAPERGSENIRKRLTQLRDATEYLRDQTIAGMNAGVPLFTLMGEITLPPELDIPQGHGKVPWIVRAIWEENSGWFRYESSTELYDVPLNAIGPELVELVGGIDPLLKRCQVHLEADRPLEAMHYADLVLQVAAGDRRASQLKLQATEILLEASGRENFSEVRWLESEIRDLREALA
jgi:alkyl sulfatase BDS1-like metallo-beta-lactamase superfamily hydrolase